MKAYEGNTYSTSAYLVTFMVKKAAGLCFTAMCLVLATFYALPLTAATHDKQKTPFRLTHLAEQFELTQNSITDIMQDSEGFIWVATLGGLHKYDGISFKRVELEGALSNLKTSGGQIQQISALLEDSGGHIWVGAGQGRVFKIDKVKGEITNFTLKLNPDAFAVEQTTINSEKAYGGVTYSILEDDYGRIWLGADQGIAIYNPLTDRIDINPQFDNAPEQWRGVAAMAKDEDGNVWLGTNHGLYLIDFTATKVLKHYRAASNGLGGDTITALLCEQQVLWIGTANNGLTRFDRHSGGFSVYRAIAHDSTTIAANFVRDILRDAKGRLWLALQAGGMALYHPASDNFERFVRDKDNPYGLPNNNVWRLFEDRSNVLWIGTAGAGLVQLVPSARKFEVLKSVPFQQNSLSDDFVWSFAFDGQELLWIATLDGLNSYDFDSGEVEVFRPDPPDRGEIRDNQLISVAAKDDSHLWVGKDQGKVWLFDVEEGQFSRLTQPQFNDSFETSRIWFLYQDKTEHLWISSSSGTYRLSPAQQRQALNGETRFDVFIPHITRSMYEDGQGRYWLGTQNGGIVVLDRSLNKLAQLVNEPLNPNSLSHNTVRSIAQDGDGYLWFGTHSGLNQLMLQPEDAIGKTFKRYFAKDGLGNDTIYSILPQDDQLWLATNHGLAKFDSKTHQVVNYTVEDGLPANEFNGGAAIIAPDNTLIFGGVDGITYFKPRNLVENGIAPKLSISALSVNNTPIGNPFSIAHIKQVDLSYLQNNLQFEFAALDFHHPQQNQLLYRLYPYQTEWEPSKTGMVKYANLPVGEYHFQVKGANNDGVWARDTKVLNVVIHPPYWLHPAAFAFYILVVLYLLYVYRKNERAQKAYLERIVTLKTKDLANANAELAQSIESLEEAREAAEHANELKSTFLANMSHEIRTPLTAIIGFTEHALNPSEDARERKSYLQRVLRSGQHLLHLINEILDLSKIEAQKLELENTTIQLFELMADIESYALAQSQNKGLAFKLDYQYPLPEHFNGDLFRVRQVLYNLCSNAIKFTKEGQVKVSVRYIDSHHQLHFAVKDSGIGMSGDELKRLFQPFVQADSSITRQFGGSGLGLVISQKLVNLMQGELTVQSTKGVGSTFDVVLPCRDSVKLVYRKPLCGRHEQKQSQALAQYPDAHILLAEDNEDNQLLIQLMLKPFGAKVTVVGNGVDAVEAVLLGGISLVLMDIQMPVMGGLEAAALMRSGGIKCPIVALTANVMKQDIDTYLAGGFDATLAKPIQNHVFFDTVNRYLSQQQTTGDVLPDAIDELIDELSDTEAFKQLKAGYKAGLGALAQTFVRYEKDKQWDALREHAHSVKGSAANMGFAELTELAAQIEQAVIDKDFDRAKALVSKMAERCQQLRQ